MFTFDSKYIRSRYNIRAQQEQETFEVVNRRRFGANHIPVISFHSQAPHVQGHFEIWKPVFTAPHCRRTAILVKIFWIFKEKYSSEQNKIWLTARHTRGAASSLHQKRRVRVQSWRHINSK